MNSRNPDVDDVREWLKERIANTRRIAATKNGPERDGWLEDERFLAVAFEALDYDRMFPIQDGAAIPWRIIAVHERQAQQNHNQTLKHLASRGGLGVQELYYVLRDERWSRPFVDMITAKEWVARFVDACLAIELAFCKADRHKLKGKIDIAGQIVEALRGGMSVYETYDSGLPELLAKWDSLQ